MIKVIYLLPLVSLFAAQTFSSLDAHALERRKSAPFGEVSRINPGGSLTQLSTWDSSSTIDKVCNDHDKAPATLDQGCTAATKTIKITCVNGGHFQITCDLGCNETGDPTKCLGNEQVVEFPGVF